MSINSENTTTLENSDLNLDITNRDHVIFPTICQRKLAWLDITDGLKKWPIWLMLAYQDIKLRYRRSVLGPFWLTLSMAITVYSMGYLYAHLFHIDLKTYYPFLIAGMLTWALISSLITELTDTLVAFDGLIKQIKLPYSVHIHRVASRNMIIFFHNILVIVPVWIIFHADIKVNAYTLLAIPGLALIYLNAISYGLLLSMIGARYRDISQVIKSLVQVIFFVTPVLWSPLILSEHNRYIAEWNPVYSFIELVRAPLLGQAPTLMNISMVMFVTLIGIAMCAKIFVRYRTRIIYWL